MSTWPAAQNQVQGSKDPVMTQAQLTYAQKVKGRQQQQQQQAAQSMQARSLQPIQTMQAQSIQPAMQASMQRMQPAVTSTVSSSTPKPSSFRMVPAQNMLQSALTSYSYPYNYRARDFFDRGVQSNVNHAVNQYYSYQAQSQPQSRAQPQAQSRAQPANSSFPPMRQSQNRWATSSQAPPQPNRRRGTQGRASQDSRAVRGGMHMNTMNTMNSMNSMKSRTRTSSSSNGNLGGNLGGNPNGNVNLKMQSNGYCPRVSKGRSAASGGPNTPPHRDVLCWIFENQGQCRYGAKCQWLHLDRESGQYVPTMYVTNSLDRKAARAQKAERLELEDTKHKEQARARAPAGAQEEAKQTEQEQEKGQGQGQEAEPEQEQDLEAIKSKFQRLMEKNIARNSQQREKAKQGLLEEDTKDESKDAEDSEAQAQAQGGKAKVCRKVTKGGNYGSYGTTFDRHNVCWEFNTFVGCRKGTACKWAHQYLAKESAHPYTGEKLNGMAVRKFRLSNNI